MSDKKPLIKHVFTADPSAHVFDGTLYVYPSHDIATDIQDNDNGDQYAMEDYHVFSFPQGLSTSEAPEAVDHGSVLHMKDVPWVGKQMWAPDAAFKNGKYYLYFPARDKAGVMRIGVAEGPSPTGPFTADPEPIKGSYSIDPACFVDEDGESYLYFGGIWGGQLQCWSTGSFAKAEYEKMEASGADRPALHARVARLTPDMHQFAEEVKEVVILDPETKQPVKADDHDRRFFEAAWVHKYQGKYYFSYSTGDTHFLCYAIGETPYGPFTYAGRILEPVVGWTTHHSIVQVNTEQDKGKWYLFYHDASLSGKNHLRCIKAREIKYDAEGKIYLAEKQGPTVHNAE
ncbi:hypothetical protein D9619_012480 [Psilocybe cf. subviscida]|uniref:Glycoside hydrolase family 43 protein n=1 Tax=Psilocybe cf. subviscida TaxID=2480587 RepID=A0A8H5AR51_9AGAR|nr:hypothetical protein D9619_012480 [Psilocybe cf. subviscida]